MIDYAFTDTGSNELDSLQMLLSVMCKENKINQLKQDYRVFFSKEKVFIKNNNIRFTSGSKKYLSFYGKFYSDKNNKILETIHSESGDVLFRPESNTILIIFGGVDNSTVLDNDQEIIYFYIAPRHLLDLQNMENWQPI